MADPRGARMAEPLRSEEGTRLSHENVSSPGQNLALTVLSVQNSFDSGGAIDNALTMHLRSRLANSIILE